MKAKELKCPTCGAGASPDSIDPEYELDSGDNLLGPNIAEWAVNVACVNGHHFIAGKHSPDGPLETKGYTPKP